MVLKTEKYWIIIILLGPIKLDTLSNMAEYTIMSLILVDFLGVNPFQKIPFGKLPLKDVNPIVKVHEVGSSSY